MKILSLITLIPLAIALIATPLTVQSKEHNNKRSHHVVVNGSQHHGHGRNHHSTRSHKQHHRSRHSYGHNKHHSYGHNKHHSYGHHSYRKHYRHHNNIASAIILGTALHYGIHGRHHNGHAWCPVHHVYHTHAADYNGNPHYDGHRRTEVDSYIEQQDSRCYRITEYDNGDERKKRIRNHHCDALLP